MEQHAKRELLLFAFQPLDVCLDLFRHLDQNLARPAIEDRLGKAPALLGPAAHVGD